MLRPRNPEAVTSSRKLQSKVKVSRDKGQLFMQTESNGVAWPQAFGQNQQVLYNLRAMETSVDGGTESLLHMW